MTYKPTQEDIKYINFIDVTWNTEPTKDEITKMYNVYEVSNLKTLVKKGETFVKEGQAAKLNVSASSVKDIKKPIKKATKKSTKK